MPTTTTADNHKAIGAALLQLAEKAWRSGGGMGSSSGLGGSHGHGVGKPGSRGGHPWTDSKGNIRYGAQPKGGHSGGGAAKPTTVSHNPALHNAAMIARIRASRGVAPHQKPTGSHGPALHPHSLAATRLRQTRMLEELHKVLRTGKDPHGNKLNAKQLAQVNTLITALRIQTHPMHNQGVGRKKEIAVEVTKEIAEKAAAHLPFTVFKDAKGQWRWIGVSSSAAQDHDGETVSLKALQEDTATKDITGTHGPLNWWHTPIKLGTCDFNAMDGPLLVESGTFVNDRVAVAVSKAISNGNLKPAMSLEFEHNEPGPPVLAGRVFTKINKVGRALLPAEKASNLLTSFKVYSLNNAALADEKGSKKMLTEEKQKKALELFGPELLEALSNDNQVAVKMAEAMNLSFKAMAPPAPVVETPAVVAPVEVAPDAVVVVEPVPAPVVSAVAPVVVETPVEEAPLEVDTEAIFETLTQSITERVLAGIATASATSTKEVSDAVGVMTLALKENTAALNKVVTENVALKARLDALEGTQPAQVRARASQQGGIPADQLDASHKELVDPAQKEVDPYANIVRQLGLIPVSRG